MRVFKFGGASVKSAEAVQNLANILNGHHDNLVVVVSAMGKTTDLLENLVKFHFAGDQRKWEVFEQFKNYHGEICDQLFGSGQIPETVLAFFTELDNKLKKAPSLDFDFE